MPRFRTAALATSALVVAACTPPAPPATPAGPSTATAVAAPAPAPPAAGLDGAAVGLHGRLAPPADLHIDGDLGEWGTLDADPPPVMAEARNVEPPASPPTALPLATDAPPADAPPAPASHVAVALGPDGLSAAGRLRGDGKDGVWLTLDFGAPELPPIGYFERGGGVREITCEGNPYSGEPLGADEQASCRATLKAHTDWVAAETDRYVARYRVTARGVERERGGKLEPVVGAELGWQAEADGARFELRLPPLGLPRTTQAPLESAQAAAAVLGDAPPVIGHGDDEAVPASAAPLTPEPPVDFEPHGALRRYLFGALPPARGFWPPFIASYQPGEGVEMERVAYAADGMALETQRDVLFAPLAEVGGLRLLQVLSDGGLVLVPHPGSEPELVSLDGASIVASEKRGQGLHVIAFGQWTETDSWCESARWVVYEFRPDGTYEGNLVMPVENENTCWETVASAHDEKFTTLTLKGHARDFDASGESKPVPQTVTWRWNASGEAYVGKAR